MKLFSSLAKPNTKVPITYQIGWWANQHLLQIDAFEVAVVKSELNLMNSHSLLSYTIQGKLKVEGPHLPYIKKIHHSEKMLTVHKNGPFVPERLQGRAADAEIQLIPIVALKLHKKATKKTASQIPQWLPFSLCNQFRVSSLHWGKNIFKFVCGSFEEEIVLWQRK